MDNREVVNWLIRIRDRLMTTSSKQFKALTIAIEKQEQDRWIPCKERPPEKPGWYAITVHNEAIPEDEDGPEIPEKWGTGAAYWDWVYPNDPTKKEWGKRWVNAYDYDGYITSDDCITAWRPLPKPYTEEES